MAVSFSTDPPVSEGLFRRRGYNFFKKENSYPYSSHSGVVAPAEVSKLFGHISDEAELQSRADGLEEECRKDCDCNLPFILLF